MSRPQDLESRLDRALKGPRKRKAVEQIAAEAGLPVAATRELVGIAAALAVTCPLCAAEPGERCAVPQGAHLVRSRAKPPARELPQAGTLILVRFGSGGTQLARVLMRRSPHGLLIVEKFRDSSRSWTNPIEIPERDFRGLPDPKDPRIDHAVDAISARPQSRQPKETNR